MEEMEEKGWLCKTGAALNAGWLVVYNRKEDERLLLYK